MRPEVALAGWLFGASVLSAQTRPTAFVDVSVVITKTGTTLDHQTVVVERGVIRSVGPAKDASIPGTALRIEGGVLLPGFADMHTHPGREADLLTYLANGITTIRVMWGGPDQLRRRRLTRAGKLLGPAIVTAGRIIDGPPPSQPAMKVLTDPRLARAEVEQQRRAGYDFIKVYNSVPAAVYDSIVAVAASVGMPVAGHVPFAVGLEGALRAHQASIEHLRGYVAELVPKEAPVQPGPSLRSRSVVWNYVDLDRLPPWVEKTRQAGVWNVPTLVVTTHNMLPSAEHRALLRRPEVEFLDPADLPDRSKISYLADFADSDYVAAQRGLDGQMAVVLALYRAGSGLLVGTDSWLQGFAFQEELELLERAGLPRAAVLDLATRAPARFLHLEGRVGEIAVGQRADLQLFGANPLDGLANLRTRQGVLLGGRWLPSERLTERMKQAQLTRNK